MGVALAMALVTTLSAQSQPTLEDVLQRMHAYLKEYAQQLPALIATETYEQAELPGIRSSRARRLISDYGLIQIPGEPQWQGFREVLSVDGRPVTDSRRRLVAIFGNPSASTLRQARLIAEESARYNIGAVSRTINDPAVVLEVLDPRHANRLRFERSGESTIEGTRVWVVRFVETGRATVIHRSDGTPLPLEGRVWIQHDSGRIPRAEITVEPGFGSRCTLEVNFQLDPRVGMMVPVRMSEVYYNRDRAVIASGNALYSNYRKFTVVTEEDIGVK